MNRKKARGKMLDFARRVYLYEHGNLKGFGAVAKFYRDEWRPDFEGLKRWNISGYKEAVEALNPHLDRLRRLPR